MHKFLATLLCSCIAFYSGAQIIPAEGAHLNYRLVGFSVPSKAKTSKYKVEIATGNYSADDAFSAHITNSASGEQNKLIAEVPAFGAEYTWRVVYTSSKSTETKSTLHHFSTVAVHDMDTSVMRMRVTKTDPKYSNSYFFVDATRGMYDMNGQPVWYVPSLKGVRDEDLKEIRDIKITPQGTITFLLLEKAFEINYQGDILWQTPDNGKVSGDSIEHYHHEFTRLNDGNYLVLGKEYVLWKLPTPLDSAMYHRSGMDMNPNVLWDSIRKALFIRMEFGTIIEYDKAGNVIWSWKSTSYFKQPDSKYGLRGMAKFFDTHENSLYFDEKEKMMYLGFRNLSEVLKIKYPEGNVISTYKNFSREANPRMGNLLYCYQHAVKEAQDGSLYLFDNNICSLGAPAEIVMLQQPDSATGGLKKTWAFDCPLPAARSTTPIQFVAGGNVTELPNYDIFAAQYGDLYCNLFIVSKDKRILWNAYPEKWNPDDHSWDGIDMYRASIVPGQKQVEQLIWHEK